ncbi:MAG: SDR family oxidoreductase [Nanoarchaeota archaeon]
MGSATAVVLAKKGAIVHMVSKTLEKLADLKDYISSLTNAPERIEYSAIDLMDAKKSKDFINHLPRDNLLYWFHCVGLSSGSYKLPGSGNRWLPFEEITNEHFETEVMPLWISTMNMAKAIVPRMREQGHGKAVLISSMSATRSYIYGASHCPAEGAMDRLANTLTLELYKENIWITTLRAGAIDTGTYDAQDVQDSIKKICLEYGCDWNAGLKLAPPSSVGEIVACVFASNAHIPGISLVSQGQLPHESS